jgi:hypothetical protein
MCAMAPGWPWKHCAQEPSLHQQHQDVPLNLLQSGDHKDLCLKLLEMYSSSVLSSLRPPPPAVQVELASSLGGVAKRLKDGGSKVLDMSRLDEVFG